MRNTAHVAAHQLAPTAVPRRQRALDAAGHGKEGEFVELAPLRRQGPHKPVGLPEVEHLQLCKCAAMHGYGEQSAKSKGFRVVGQNPKSKGFRVFKLNQNPK